MKKHSVIVETFGSYIRSLRIRNNIGQRELANLIGVAPSYLNDIEKNKRTAPRVDIIDKLSNILKADLNLLYDLAGNSKKTLAPDIIDFIEMLEGPVGLTDCSTAVQCDQECCCTIKDPMTQINNKIIGTLKDITLDQFMKPVRVK